MADSEHPPTDTLPDLSCGSCGAPVRPADVTCPACGVLLAAYRAPVGASSSGPAPSSATISTEDETSATREAPSLSMTPEPAGGPGNTSPPFSTPSFSTPAFHPPPIHKPASQSPIGDALQRSRDRMDASRPDNVQAAADADELSRMADAVDELSEMADGVDELSEMAAGGDTTLARQVGAELAGAKVTFDGAKPVIRTRQVEITQTPGDEPSIVKTRPFAQNEDQPGTRPAPGQTRQQAPQRRIPSVYEDSVGTAGEPLEDAGPPRATPIPGKGFDASAVVRWIPFILIGLFLLGFGRMIPGFGAAIGFVIVIGLIYLLLKVSAASSRKTTSMPRDDTWNRKKRR